MSKVIMSGMGIFHFFILLVCYLDMNTTSPIFPNFLFKNIDLVVIHCMVLVGYWQKTK